MLQTHKSSHEHVFTANKIVTFRLRIINTIITLLTICGLYAAVLDLMMMSLLYEFALEFSEFAEFALKCAHC